MTNLFRWAKEFLATAWQEEHQEAAQYFRGGAPANVNVVPARSQHMAESYDGQTIGQSSEDFIITAAALVAAGIDPPIPERGDYIEWSGARYAVNNPDGGEPFVPVDEFGLALRVFTQKTD